MYIHVLYIDNFPMSFIRILSACVKEIKGAVANRPSSGNLRFVICCMLTSVCCSLWYIFHAMLFTVYCLQYNVFYTLYCCLCSVKTSVDHFTVTGLPSRGCDALIVTSEIRDCTGLCIHYCVQVNMHV